MDPRQYYNQLYSALLEAGKARGVPHPETLAHLGATQSAHETAWGRSVPSNNYFGIKGGSGPAIRTHEVINGRSVAINDRFRQYPNMQASAQDYVDLIRSKPRYSGVLNAATVKDAINAQARSGYATDPRYGQKLAAIHARGSGGAGMPEKTMVASNQAQPRLADSPAFKQPTPANITAAQPLTQQQIAQPRIEPPHRPQSFIEKLNPIQPAYGGELPRSETLPRINPADPSGPLRPAPVAGPSATPEQIAQPLITPSTTSYADAAARMRGMSLSNAYAPGVYEKDSFMTQFGDNARTGDMLPETPYAANMATAPSPYLMNEGLSPVTLSTTPMAPFEPNMPTQHVTPLTEVNLPATDMPTITPESFVDPGPTFTPDAQPPIEMPHVGMDAGGGGEDMMSGLEEALSNIGGGGGGGDGGGQQQGSGSIDPLLAAAAIPDFPSATGGIGQLIAQQGQLANQPVPIQMKGQNPFQLKPIGQAGQQQAMDNGQAPLNLKRLFS